MSIERAYRLFFEGKIDSAKKIVKRLIEKSASAKALFLYGLICYREKNLSEALWAIEKATELEKDFYESWILKSHILRALGRFREALDCLNTALNIQIQREEYVDYEIFIHMAEIYMDIGDFDKACEFIDKALEINPKDSDALEVLKKIERIKHEKED